MATDFVKRHERPGRSERLLRSNLQSSKRNGYFECRTYISLGRLLVRCPGGNSSQVPKNESQSKAEIGIKRNHGDHCHFEFHFEKVNEFGQIDHEPDQSTTDQALDGDE